MKSKQQKYEIKYTSTGKFVFKIINSRFIVKVVEGVQNTNAH